MNIGVCGSSNVGKSTYINRLATGDFSNNEPIVTRVQMDYNNTDEANLYNMIDNANSSDLVGAFFVMFDISVKDTFNKAIDIYHQIRQNNSKIPIALIGHKVDIPARKVKSNRIVAFLQEKTDSNLKYFDVSAKSCYNFDHPFSWLASLKE